MRRVPFMVLALIALLLLPACIVVELPSAEQARPQAPQPVTSAETVDVSAARDVVARLKKAGLRCSIASEPSAGEQGPLFDPGEFLLETTGGASLRLYLFSDSDAAKGMAARVRPNGIRTPDAGGASSMGTFMSPEYPGRAHFFTRGRAIVVYFVSKADRRSGEADRVLGALREAFGEEFAQSRQ